ncbi:isocitrate lyase/phosphoenolpyruvate mutase family protein [uncultured Erythrobacter sp.]|uniref:isocitrate lyase/PEP mutase family protein n=1 Tax=uncultured Erythrobacter sp. TaxID=263913 RepID=UPI0026162573|nr:isocitrate lyase/phosphoenolpyruvate mutase family protein [uncultured Erythrobacter sp.]
MNKSDFARLHHGDTPLVLYNIWDAGSAQAVARAGAKAIATGSSPVAGANGYADGQNFPMEAALAVARSIIAAVDVPVTIDFEGGYATEPEEIAANTKRLADTGAVGCNFEDQIVGGEGLHAIADQAERVKAAASSGLFVNARTDLFLSRLKAGKDANQSDLVDQAVERAAAYAEAGAECFFAPGLSDPELIARLCEEVVLPVNIIRLPNMVANAQLGELGVARISYGPGPWKTMIAELEDTARAAFAT